MDYTAVTVLGGFLALLIGVWKIARDIRGDLDRTVKLLFKRFDDHKDTVDKKLLDIIVSNDGKYVRSDLCAQTKEIFKDEFKRINEKLDLLLEERRNG